MPDEPVIDRRAFLATTLAAVSLPRAVAAQPPARLTRIAILGSTRAEDLPPLEGLRHGLRERGYIDGENVAIEHRWAHGRFERLPELAAELVALKPAVIVALVTQASVAASKATSTIPIVMVGVGDPVGAGLVASLARPGGNITGNSSFSVEVIGSRSTSSRASRPSAGASSFSGTRPTPSFRVRC